MDLIRPTVTRKPMKYRGIIASQDYNDFQESAVNDIVGLCTSVNVLSTQQADQLSILQAEITALRNEVATLKSQNDYEKAIAGYRSDYFSWYTDFKNADIVWDDRIGVKSRAMISSRFGEITLPMRNVQEKFFSYAIDNGAIITPADLSASVTAIFAKDGTTKDWEFAGKIYPGDPLRGFSGFTNEYWSRKVEFDLSSDVAQVECEITVSVPRRASPYANLLEIIPYPSHQVDVTYVGICPDLSNSFTQLNAVDENSAQPFRIHFSPRMVQKVRIRLRQTKWAEENGKKVFRYGLREVRLKLVDYDRSYTSGAAFGVNNTAIIRISPPAGYRFDRLARLDIDPDWLNDTVKYVHLKLLSSLDSTDSLWDSDTDVLPQNLAEPLQLGSSTTLYAVFELQYALGSGSSIFSANSTPFVRGLGLTYRAIEA